MELSNKAAYLQGLVDGLGVDESTKEGKIIKAMAALLGEMADAIAAMDEDLTHAYDQINDLSEELEDLEADLYEDEDAEDEDDDAADEDEDAGDDDIASEPFYEVACPACGETVYVSEDDLEILLATRGAARALQADAVDLLLVCDLFMSRSCRLSTNINDSRTIFYHLLSMF
jgi:hypothetical protein